VWGYLLRQRPRPSLLDIELGCFDNEPDGMTAGLLACLGVTNNSLNKSVNHKLEFNSPFCERPGNELTARLPQCPRWLVSFASGLRLAI